MKKLKITSNIHGKQTFLVDDEDFQRVKDWGGKWTLVKKRGMYYAQKSVKRVRGKGTPRKIIELQRFVMQPKEGEYVDHINKNTLDNRRENLRVCTNAANLRNGRMRKNNTSGVIGVWFDKRRKKNFWIAEIKVMYKKIYLGGYTNRNDAINARKVAELKYWNI